MNQDLQDLSVLIVDDDQASAKLVAVVLRAHGCQILVAKSAEEALESLKNFRPRVVILDLVLPMMSGLLLVQRLKSDPRTAPIVCIAITALNGPEAERLVLNAGCAAYVRKPIDPLSLPELLLTHLGEIK